MKTQIFKQVIGVILLFGFIGYMSNKFLNNVSGLEDRALFILVFVVVVAIIILIINRILTY